MAKFWQTAKFEAASLEWEARLRDSGFVDVERQIKGERHLTKPASLPNRLNETAEVVRESRLKYFTLLSQKCHDERRFEDESDRLIMERTAEGRTIREISLELYRLGMPKSNRDTIRYVRRRYESRWGIKSWKKEEMVSRKATK
jgi:hypothetical protein